MVFVGVLLAWRSRRDTFALTVILALMGWIFAGPLAVPHAPVIAVRGAPLVLVLGGIAAADCAGRAAQTRRTALRALSLAGWTPAQRAALLVAELACVGALGGTVGVLVGLPYADGVANGQQAVMGAQAIVIGLSCALVSGIAHLRSTRVAAPAVIGVRDALRTPVGRSAGNAAVLLAIATGAAALTAALGLRLGYGGRAHGVALGRVVTVELREADLLAIAACLAVVVLLLWQRLRAAIAERRGSMSVLSLLGCDPHRLRAFLTGELLALTLSGSVIGSVITAVTLAAIAPATAGLWLGAAVGCAALPALIVAGGWIAVRLHKPQLALWLGSSLI
jgi:hypothetical protein